MYQVLLGIFDHMEVELILVSWKKKKLRKESERRGKALGISYFIKDIDYNGVSKEWKRRIEKSEKKEKERIFNSKVVQREKMS